MEVLRPSSAGSRHSHLSNERSHRWSPEHSSLASHKQDHSPFQFGPRAPPSPPYEVMGSIRPSPSSNSCSLPPISHLLQLSRDGRNSPERQSQSSAAPRSSPSQANARHGSTLRDGFLMPSPISTTGPGLLPERDMQPPTLNRQTLLSTPRVDPALFGDSRARLTAQTPPHSARSSFDEASRRTSSPSRQLAAATSPLVAFKSAPFHSAPTARYDQRSLTLPPVPGSSSVPRALAYDSPMQAYQSSLPAQQRREELAPHSGRALLPLYRGESPRTLASANSDARFHPYHQTNRGLDRASPDNGTSRPYPSPPLAPIRDGPATQASSLQDRYQCPTCAKAFSRPSSLRIHSHSHTGEKPFVCPKTGCGKAFSVRSNMKRHERGCQVVFTGIASEPADTLAAPTRDGGPAVGDE